MGTVAHRAVSYSTSIPELSLKTYFLVLLDLSKRYYNISKMARTELEKLIRKLIRKGDEYDKFEVKSSYDLSQKRDRIRLVKCIAAIANSDSTYFDNIGYIVLGAKRGKLGGGFDALEKDSTSANIHNWVRNYIEPRVNFSVERFKDPMVGCWGVIVIPPSSEMHVFRKEYSDLNLNIRIGDVYVRHGDSITLADKSDHDRLQRRKFQSTIDEFKSEIKTLKQEIKEQKALQPDLKLYFTDEKSNLNDELEVQPVFIEKTREEYLSELSEDKEIREIENKLKDLRNEIDTGKREGISISIELSKVKLIDYEKALKDYLEKLKEFKVSYQKYLSQHSQVISLEFALFNAGNYLAEGITFYIYFPDGLEMSKELNFFDEPEFHEKKPRDSRRSSFADLFDSKLFIPELPSIIPKNIDLTYGGPYINKSKKSIEVEYWVNKLLHGHIRNFDPVYLLSPDREIDINLEYSIYAENVAGKSEGTLILKIKPEK